MPFQKGQSGNPAGRPPGSRNRATIFAEALFEGEAEFIFRNVIRKAVDGEPWALRLCMERLSPRLPTRASPLAFELPQIRTSADIPAALADISSKLAAGELTLDEAERYTRILERWSQMLQPAERAAEPPREIKYGWFCGDPPPGARRVDDLLYYVPDGNPEPEKAGAAPEPAIDNSIVAGNGDPEPAPAAAAPEPVIDNPIVAGKGDPEPEPATAAPDPGIDDSIAVNNGDAEQAGGRAPIGTAEPRAPAGLPLPQPEGRGEGLHPVGPSPSPTLSASGRESDLCPSEAALEHGVPLVPEPGDC
jgi:Family of unknown function (DUF5681)